jgi:hypothetical protein
MAMDFGFDVVWIGGKNGKTEPKDGMTGRLSSSK